MPVPVSLTRISTNAPCWLVLMVIRPLTPSPGTSEMAWAALTSMFRSTWLMSAA